MARIYNVLSGLGAGEIPYVSEAELEYQKKAIDLLNETTGGYIKTPVKKLYNAATTGDPQEWETALFSNQMGVGQKLLPPSTVQEYASCNKAVATGVGIVGSMVGSPILGAGASAAACAGYAAIRWVAGALGGGQSKGDKAPNIQVSSQDIATVVEALNYYLQKDVFEAMHPLTQFAVRMQVARLMAVFLGVANHSGSGDWYGGIPYKLVNELKAGAEVLKSPVWEDYYTNKNLSAFYSLIWELAEVDKRFKDMGNYAKGVANTKKLTNPFSHSSAADKGGWIAKDVLEFESYSFGIFWGGNPSSLKKLVNDYGKLLSRAMAEREKSSVQMPLRKWQSWMWTDMKKWGAIQEETNSQFSPNTRLIFKDVLPVEPKYLTASELSKKIIDKSFKEKNVTKFITTYPAVPAPLKYLPGSNPDGKPVWIWVREYNSPQGRLDEWELQTIKQVKERLQVLVPVQQPDGSVKKVPMQQYSQEWYIATKKWKSKTGKMPKKEQPMSSVTKGALTIGVPAVVGVLAVGGFWWYKQKQR